MSIVKIVLDTNCLLQCISRNSVNKIILDKLISGDYDLYLTNEILMEYEEKIADIFSSETAELIINFYPFLKT